MTMRIKARRLSATLLGATLLGAAILANPAAAEPQQVKVMIFNVWLGGDQVSMSKTLEAIRAADADIVLLQEPEGNVRYFAEQLGYAYAEPRQNMLSRFPIFDMTDSGGDFAYVELTPGHFAALANIHLDWTEYGPYAARDGKSAEEILRTESDLRLSGIQPYLELLEPIAAAGMPVILGGDFNSASDLDWTAATVGQRHQLKFPLAWPAAHAVTAAGYQDTWRTIHPDPVANPGITWSWGYPQPTLWADEALDRIDLLFARNATVDNSQIVGGAQADVGIVVTPWPSDHQAVVSTLTLEGAAAPNLLVAVPRGVTQGEVINLRLNAAGTSDGRLEDGWLEILPHGGVTGAALQTIYSNDTTDRRALLDVATYNLEPGSYDAALLDKDGTELARATFQVLLPGARPAVSSDKASYKSGEPIVAQVANAPGNRFDWVALFPAGETDEWNYVGSAYTNGAISGAVVLDQEALGGPLEPGEYELRLLLDDRYVAIAGSKTFTVRAE